MGCQWSAMVQSRKAAKRYKVSSDQELGASDQARQSTQSHATCSNQAPLVKPQDAASSAAGANNPAKAASDATATVVAMAGATKRKLDLKDFMFMGMTAETRIKAPGSVNGQQFIIDGCRDCDLFVLDHCASVTIDDCTNCRLFVGPTEASIFMRNCSSCSIAAITRQLRCRDCTDCSLLLLCRTRPIMEASSNLAFGCFDAPYAGLAAQMSAAGLSPFHNYWDDVYDFTPAAPAPGPLSTAAAGTPGVSTAAAAAAAASVPAEGDSQHNLNWFLLPADVTVAGLLGGPGLPAEVRGLLALSEPGVLLSGKPCQTYCAKCRSEDGCSDCLVAAEAEAAEAEAGQQQPAEGSTGAACDQVSADAAVAVLTPSTGGRNEDVRDATAGTASGTSAAAAGGGGGGCSTAAAAKPTALLPADRQAVIKTHGCRTGTIYAGVGLFVLFSGGSRGTAQQWVCANITSQQQQEGSSRQLTEQQQQQEEEQGAPTQPVEQQHAPLLQQHHRGLQEPCAEQQQQLENASNVRGLQGAPNNRHSSWCTSTSPVPAVLLWTNEAVVVAPAMLTQLTKAAGWSSQQIKQLGCRAPAAAKAAAPACVGLQVACADQGVAQRLAAAAEVAGALCSNRTAPAKLFRHLGLDG